MRLTLHCFHRKHIILCVNVWISPPHLPPSRRGVKTRETDAKHTVTGFHSQKQRLEK